MPLKYIYKVRGLKMAIVTVRLNKEEEKAFKDYADTHDVRLSTLLKKFIN